VLEFEHGGGGFAGRGPKGYRRSDERIREDVCDRLADDPRIDASDVEVAVDSGEVILSGTVRSREEKRISEDVIETISGVHDIQNTLRVSLEKR
jgi:osmotically-inducible protein OsmY